MIKDAVVTELDRWEAHRGPMWDLAEAARREGFKGTHGAELISFAYRRKLDLMDKPARAPVAITPLIIAALAFIIALAIVSRFTG